MSRRFNKGSQGLPGGTPATILTPAMFFGKVGNFKYADPNEFLAFGATLRDEDEEEMYSFFSLVREGLKMAINRKKQTDRGGRVYKYENFLRNKGPEGVKVIIFGKLEQFIKDYQNGLFKTDFTLDDLISEAEKDH